MTVCVCVCVCRGRERETETESVLGTIHSITGIETELTSETDVDNGRVEEGILKYEQWQ